MSLIVACPSRNRPAKASEAYRSFEQTKARDDSRMVFVVDSDDRTLPEYQAKGLPVEVVPPGAGGMGPPLNEVAVRFAAEVDVVGFAGDDHRFRTRGWDEVVDAYLVEGGMGMVYGKDLVRDDIPTHIFIRSSIVLALGWMALPGARHLYLDNTWAELGHRAGCLVQVPDMVIEHMHPTVGKAQWDADYARVNAQHMYSHDGQVFSRWIDSGRAELDADIVRRILA